MTIGRTTVGNDFLPIFLLQGKAKPTLVAFCGTGFLVAPKVLVTCWHCVSEKLKDRKFYGVGIPGPTGAYQFKPLMNVARDANGRDLATANVDMAPTLGLSVLRQGDVPMGTAVFTYGYPYTSISKREDGALSFGLAPRYMEGYVMRPYYNKSLGKGGESQPSYELNFAAPEGLSGSPLIRTSTSNTKAEFIGVIYENHDVETIVEFSKHDPETGVKTPEALRIVSFGVAHYTESLRQLRGPATNDLPLVEHLESVTASNKRG